MPISLSNLVNILAGDISKNESKDYISKCLECTEENFMTEYKDFECYLECVGIKDKLLQCECLKCNKDHENKLCKSSLLKSKEFPNIYKFCNTGIDKFILMLWKGVLFVPPIH